MSKFTRFLSLILSVVMSFSLFAACDGGKETDNETNVITKVSNSSRVDLYNFEQWKPDFSCIKFQEHFGVVRRNKDKQYTKSGDYSAKLMPIGGHIDPETPVLWFPTFSAAWDFDYRDFSYVDYVSVWMYNANEVDKDVIIGLVSKYKGFEKITKLQGQTFTLKANDWTLIKYAIDFGAMSIGSDVDREDMIDIQGIYLQFETAVSPDADDAPVFYADDISLIYKETVNGFDSPLYFDANAETKYLIDFEEIWHSSIFYIQQVDPLTAPTQKVVRGADVGVQPTTGNRMLQFNFPLVRKVDGYTTKWHYLKMPQQMMRAFWKTYIYDSELDNPYIVPREDWDEWYICYDVYNASEYTVNLSWLFFAEGDKWDCRGGSTTMNPGEWATVKMTVDHIAKLSSTWRVYQGMQPAEYYLNEDRITNPGGFGITVDNAPQVTNAAGQKVDLAPYSMYKMTYYLDSFRLIHMA